MGITLENIDIHSTSRLQEQGYPWEAWDLLRRDAPVYWYERDDIEPFWAVTRYDDVHFVGSNDRLFVNGGARLRLASASDDREAKERSLRRAEVRGWDPDEVPDLVYMDKPRHTEFRNLAARSFTPRAMRALEAHLASYATRFIDEFVDLLDKNGEADLVEDFAVKLPLATICDIMGLPVDDWSRIHTWTGAFFESEAEVMRLARDDETLDDLRFRLSMEFYEYCAATAERAKAAQDGSLTARVATGEVEGQPLTAQQLHGYLVLLIGAGNETTRNAIAGGVVALAATSRPTRAAVRASRPDRHRDRRDPAVGVAGDPVRAHGHRRRRARRQAHSQLATPWASSTRRPTATRRAFDDPYRFDITRSPNYHQAFGHGAHFCLGANLARWELRAALRALLPVLPRLQLVGEPQRVGHLHLGIVKHQTISLR